MAERITSQLLHARVSVDNSALMCKSIFYEGFYVNNLPTIISFWLSALTNMLWLRPEINKEKSTSLEKNFQDFCYIRADFVFIRFLFVTVSLKLSDSHRLRKTATTDVGGFSRSSKASIRMKSNTMSKKFKHTTCG